MGKGSNPRPVLDRDAFRANFDRIFGKGAYDAMDDDAPEKVGQEPAVEGDESDED